MLFGGELNKCGYKEVYEPDSCILSKYGTFVGFGYFSYGMFKLNVDNNVADSIYMACSSIVESSHW